ncbi:MAG TPA: histidine phosphatase family protein [Rhodothermales bacterium]|nr:histidine phosphatase family protein [Rhodothermales bacterium]
MQQVVWIARHGNRQDFVDPNWRSGAARPFDPGLSEDGIEQAKRLGRRLVGEGISRIFASPFLRTVQTAHYVAEAIDAPIYLEPGICEWLNAEWFHTSPALLPAERLAVQFPRIDPEYEPVLVPEYPETADEAYLRAGHTARLLARRYVGTVLLVGHGMSVCGAAQGLAEDIGEFECALCSVVKLVQDEGIWRAELCGDVSHLEESVGADRFV